ncbi:MAG: MFS transporter [Chloroflexi bacterium]|nr:MFS transporter [Chloroflexota bacterium]
MTDRMRAFFATDREHFRWIIVVANFLILLALWSPNAGFGVFLPRIAEDFGWSRGSVAVVFSISMAIGAPVGVVIGRLIDKHAPWKVMVFEVVISCIGYILTSFTQSIWHLYLFLGVFLGMGMAGGYLIPTITTARWFQENRGMAMGIVLSGNGLGYLLGPIFAVALIAEFDWRGAYVIFALALGLVAILPACILRNPPSAPRPAVIESNGLAKTHETSKSGPAHTIPAITLRQAVRTSTFWMLLAIWMFQAFAQMMFVVHVVPLVADKGIAMGTAAGVLGIYGLGALSGRLVLGSLSDRLGARATLAISAAVGALALGTILASQDVAVLYAAALAFGVALSGSDTTFVRTLPDILGNKSLGVMVSGLNLGWRSGATIGPALAGFVFDATGLYALPFGVAIVCLLMGIALFFLATRPQQRMDRVLKLAGAAS